MKRVLACERRRAGAGGSCEPGGGPAALQPVATEPAPIYRRSTTGPASISASTAAAPGAHSSWDSAPASFDLSGGLIGGTIGYNWQTGPVGARPRRRHRLGQHQRHDDHAFCPLGCKTENNWLGDRARPRRLCLRPLHALLHRRPRVRRHQGDDLSGLPGNGQTNAGWTLGGGVEFAFAGNWTAKAEYLYVDLGNLQLRLQLRRAHSRTDNVSFTSHIVRGGINLSLLIASRRYPKSAKPRTEVRGFLFLSTR